MTIFSKKIRGARGSKGAMATPMNGNHWICEQDLMPLICFELPSFLQIASSAFSRAIKILPFFDWLTRSQIPRKSYR